MRWVFYLELIVACEKLLQVASNSFSGTLSAQLDAELARRGSESRKYSLDVRHAFSLRSPIVPSSLRALRSFFFVFLRFPSQTHGESELFDDYVIFFCVFRQISLPKLLQNSEFYGII